MPEQCQDRVRRRGEWFSYYGARCLQRHGNDRAYPQACLRDIRTGRGRHRDVYGARCLLREGYREARRGH